MRKIGYTTLQRDIERRLKVNNKARELLGMELKKPIVAFSNDVVYITDNYSMFFVIPQSEYILPYKPNVDEYTFKKYVNIKAEDRLYYETDAINFLSPERDLLRYCPLLEKHNIKVYFLKELLQRFYKDTNKLNLYNDGTKDGVTHVYRNGTFVGVIAPFMKD